MLLYKKIFLDFLGYFSMFNRLLSERKKRKERMHLDQLQEIYERQVSRIYRIARLYLKNVADAEDAVQAVFLKYIEKEIQFRNLEHEKAWFIVTTRNYCKDVLKNFWKKEVDYKDIPEQQDKEANESQILQYVMTLPAKYREIIYMYYYEEYSVREISEILKRKESTIQTQLATARKQLRQLLENDSRKGECGS